jgi:hypothetical protein
MYSKFTTYQDLEAQIGDLTKRRKLIEQSYEERTKLFSELRQKEVVSQQRLIKSYQEQNEKARLRNRTYLEEISFLSSNAQLQKDLIKIENQRGGLESGAPSSSSASNYLLKAKKNYEMYYETYLPLHYREHTQQMEEQVKKLQITKIQSKHRHELLKQELQKEQEMKNRLNHQKQDLLQILTLEQKDLMEARINHILLQEENKLIQQELQEYILNEGYRMERQVKEKLDHFHPSEFLNLPTDSTFPMPEQRKQPYENISEMLSSLNERQHQQQLHSLGNNNNPYQNFAYPIEKDFQSNTKPHPRSPAATKNNNVTVSSAASQNLNDLKRNALASMSVQQPPQQQLQPVDTFVRQSSSVRNSSSFLEDVEKPPIPPLKSVNSDRSLSNERQPKSLPPLDTDTSPRFEESNSKQPSTINPPNSTSINNFTTTNTIPTLHSTSQENLLFTISESRQNSQVPSPTNHRFGLLNRSESEFSLQGQEIPPKVVDSLAIPVHNNNIESPSLLNNTALNNTTLNNNINGNTTDTEFDVINSSNNTSNNSGTQKDQNVDKEAIMQQITQTSFDVLNRILNKCYQFIEMHLSSIQKLQLIYDYSSFQCNFSLVQNLLNKSEAINSEFWNENNISKKDDCKNVGDVILFIFTEIGAQLLPG